MTTPKDNPTGSDRAADNAERGYVRTVTAVELGGNFAFLQAGNGMTAASFLGVPQAVGDNDGPLGSR